MSQRAAKLNRTAERLLCRLVRAGGIKEVPYNGKATERFDRIIRFRESLTPEEQRALDPNLLSLLDRPDPRDDLTRTHEEELESKRESDLRAIYLSAA